MKNINFPVDFEFKISSLANDFVAKDCNGRTIAYVYQKMLKLKEDILIYEDESKDKVEYRIKADKWLDFSTAYAFFDIDGTEFGKVVRKGWKSVWKAQYEIVDENQKIQYSIKEENAWVKVLDSVLGEIPILGMLTGYFFNPSYMVADVNMKEIVRLKKMKSFFGRRFQLTQIGEMDSDDDDRIMLALMMMILLERRRG